MDERHQQKTADALYRVTLIQLVCTLLILLIVLICRRFFPTRFLQTQPFYENNFLYQTDVKDVLDDLDEI